MPFVLKDTYTRSPLAAVTNSMIKADARHYVLVHKLNTQETLMNRYCINTYNKPLKKICLTLIRNVTIMKDLDENIYLIFKDPAEERIAKLITYGNGVIPGCTILQKAFK